MLFEFDLKKKKKRKEFGEIPGLFLDSSSDGWLWHYLGRLLKRRDFQQHSSPEHILHWIQARGTIFKQLNKYWCPLILPFKTQASLPRWWKQVPNQMFCGSRKHWQQQSWAQKALLLSSGSLRAFCKQLASSPIPLPGGYVLLCLCTEEWTNWAILAEVAYLFTFQQ